MNEEVVGILVVGIGLSYALSVYVYARSLVRDWASANGFQVVKWGSQALPSVGERPDVAKQMEMFALNSKNQILLRAAFYDVANHITRTAWVRIGSFWFGLLDKDAIDVMWDDAAT